jgi:hypothetical protein
MQRPELISHRPKKRPVVFLTNLGEYYDSLEDFHFLGKGYIPKFETVGRKLLSLQGEKFVFSVDYYARFREYGNFEHRKINYYEQIG